MKHDDDGRGGLVPVGDIPIDALGDRRSRCHPTHTRPHRWRTGRIPTCLTGWCDGGGSRGPGGRCIRHAPEATLRAVDPLAVQVVEAPRAVSSDANPTRPLCAVTHASMPAARAAAVNRR